MPENEEAFTLWQAVLTQWRGAGMGIIGLDYREVRWWARELGFILSPGLWSKVRALELVELRRHGGAESEHNTGAGHKAQPG